MSGFDIGLGPQPIDHHSEPRVTLTLWTFFVLSVFLGVVGCLWYLEEADSVKLPLSGKVFVHDRAATASTVVIEVK